MLVESRVIFDQFSLVDSFENHAYMHPLDQKGNRVYRMMPGDFVERGKGTGFVHCAPAHGREDFDFGRRHNLPLVSFSALFN